MATFEDAAEELMLKLRGLEEEIAESDQRLEDLRGRMVAVKDDVEDDWSDLTEAVQSFLEKVREESDQLDQKADTTLQALTDAHNALGENATNARNEIGQAVADLDALEQQATAHTANVEPLVHDGIEAPAQSLEERAQELETELAERVERGARLPDRRSGARRRAAGRRRSRALPGAAQEPGRGARRAAAAGVRRVVGPHRRAGGARRRPRAISPPTSTRSTWSST